MKKILQEFKQFAMRGNVVDMAVGIIIGGAFGKIVSSIVADHAGGRFTCRWRQFHGFKNHLEARCNGGRQGDLSGGLH